MNLSDFPLLEPYLARWRALEARERLALSIAASALAVFLFYVLLWSPMEHDLKRLRVEVPQDRARLTVMRAQALQLAQLRASGAATHTSGGAILATLEQSAASHGLKQALTRMEPDGATGARLTLENVPFNSLVTWLNELRTNSGVRIESASIDAQTSPGMVNVRLQLRGPGG
ncbi:MAG: type II secretion system protein GspM [Acidiferrobacterales bacterium]